MSDELKDGMPWEYSLHTIDENAITKLRQILEREFKARRLAQSTEIDEEVRQVASAALAQAQRRTAIAFENNADHRRLQLARKAAHETSGEELQQRLREIFGLKRPNPR